MKLVNARRLAGLATAALAVGTLVGISPAEARTGYLGYACKITDDYQYTFQVDQGAAATKGFVGKRVGYYAKVDFPEFGVGVARSFGVTHITGEIEATVFANGSPITVKAPIPRTNVPTNTNKMVLTARGLLPPRPGAGKVVYKPGNIRFSVDARKADNSSLFKLNKGKCTMPANTKTIETVNYVKSPTTTAGTATYAKSTKRATAVVRVSATSRVPATGKVTFALFKGATKIRTSVANLAGGKATVIFAGVKAKGGYKVVATYGGSRAHNGSAVTRTFTVN